MSEKYKVHIAKQRIPKLTPKGVDFDKDVLPRQIKYALYSLVDEILKEGKIKDYFSVVQDHSDTQVEVTVTSMVHEYLKTIDELKVSLGSERYQGDVYTAKFFKERDEKDKAVKRLSNALKILSDSNLMEEYIKEGGLE